MRSATVQRASHRKLELKAQKSILWKKCSDTMLALNIAERAYRAYDEFDASEVAQNTDCSFTSR
jgi:hypothetical protein